ncbi:MAG: transporter substrate-binding domain-containing protein [Lachnospiraceae bacterium]|nr:transporter substrate-binding domain-containing protein [Lachnospiraceae bacterium]
MKINKLIRTTAAALAVLALAATTACGSQVQAASKKVITAETFGAPSPFIYSPEDPKDAIYTTAEGVGLSGYDIAVLVELFKTKALEGYTLDLRVNSNTIVDAQQGTVDFGVNNFSYNSDRAESFYFSYPYTKAKYAILTKNGTTISSFAEIAASGIPVETSAGNNVANALERWNEANPDKQINIEYTSADITAELQHIAEGTHVGIGDTPVWAAYRESYPELFANITETVISDEEALLITEHSTSHFLFGKTGAHAKEYQKLLSEGIYELYKNGTLKKLADRYTGIDIVPAESDFEYLN